jgi:hypothetical protein
MTTAAEGTPPGVSLDAAGRCQLCGDPLHPVANERTDTFIWVDASGSQTGVDADLRQLPGGDPFARLDVLTDRLKASRYRDSAAAAEYSALTIRLGGTGGAAARTHHEHWAPVSEPMYTGLVPECCGWPAWLRPSGWQCRRCRRRLGPPPPDTAAGNAPSTTSTSDAGGEPGTGLARLIARRRLSGGAQLDPARRA